MAHGVDPTHGWRLKMQELTLKIFFNKSELDEAELKEYILEHFGVEGLQEVSEREIDH